MSRLLGQIKDFLDKLMELSFEDKMMILSIITLSLWGIYWAWLIFH